MPRIFRNRIGTTKLSLFLVSAAVLALFCFAAVPSASAQTSISFYLDIESSGGPAIPSDAVVVTVTLNPSGGMANNTAKVTFQAETGYYLGYKTVINVSGTATAVITATDEAGTTNIAISTVNPGSLDGFGFSTTTSYETDNTPNNVPSNESLTLVTFALTKTSGTWASPSAVLAATGGSFSVDAAAQIGTSKTVNTSGSDTLANDTDDDGGLYPLDAVPTPEPMSYLLFGSGLLLLGVVSRKKLGLGRS